MRANDTESNKWQLYEDGVPILENDFGNVWEFKVQGDTLLVIGSKPQ